ncbi:MAG: sucrase ferredoxin [Acidimicrobiales bacterium]
MATSIGPQSTGSSGPGLLCSSWAREQHLDPIGTAGCYRCYMLLEWPLPWPRDLSDDPALAPVVASVRSAGMRLQGLVPALAGGPSHVIAYQWPDGAGARFERTELVVDPAEVVSAALAILEEPPSGDEITDVLVCTHGRRDRCCGSLGTALAHELLADPRLLGEDVRVWRTSHTGGHRFAATAIVLPYGTAWAFCDKAALARVVRRNGPMDDLLPRYRGCGGMGSPAIQALERAVLGEIGWPLFDMVRLGAELGGHRTELVVDDPSRGRSVWEAVVRVEREVPVPDCGVPTELATKTEPQLMVEGLRRRRLRCGGGEAPPS